MGVVFAIVGLAVVGAGVVVLLKFTGAGEVADPVHDRAVAAMTTGPTGAADLRRVRFPDAIRGHRMDHVDALLDRLAEQLDPPVDAPVDAPADLQTGVSQPAPASQPELAPAAPPESASP